MKVVCKCDIPFRQGGYFLGIECKAGKNKPTPLQQKNLDDIAKAGGVALVINETNLGLLETTIKKLNGE